MYTLRQGRIGSNGNEEVLYILHNTKTEALPSDPVYRHSKDTSF